MIRFGSYQQTSWDWRAAGNFMFGGTGSALLEVIALAGHSPPPLPVAATALVLVGIGLLTGWVLSRMAFRIRSGSTSRTRRVSSCGAGNSLITKC